MSLAALETSTTQAEPHRSPKNSDEARALVPALAGIVILGIAILALTWWGAWFLRRRMRKPLKPAQPVGDDWYSKPLASRNPPDSTQPPRGA